MASGDGDAVPIPREAWIRDVRRRLLAAAPVLWQDFPWRSEHLPRWQALVAEVLLHRTRATQAAAVFERIRRRYGSAAAFARADQDELTELLRPLGLRWRGRLLAELAVILGERRGRLPLATGELMKLPAVGSYAAAALLSLHANRRAVIIDTNVVRVLCRLLGVTYDGETRRKRWLLALADRLTPDDQFRSYNYALLDLAMIVCVPRSPRCTVCPLARACVTARAMSSGL